MVQGAAATKTALAVPWGSKSINSNYIAPFGSLGADLVRWLRGRDAEDSALCLAKDASAPSPMTWSVACVAWHGNVD